MEANKEIMSKDKLLDIIKNNSKHPNCAVTIWLAIEKYIISLSAKEQITNTVFTGNK